MINSNDLHEIQSILEERHSIFYEFWKVGNIVFTKEQPTAFVRFDDSGKFLEFCFNPDFWASCTNYKRAFIIAHEMLHIILAHGIRGEQYRSEDHVSLNYAMDVVINESLVRSWGFSRSKIEDSEKYCWYDTTFKDQYVLHGKNFEYYYYLLKKQNDTDVITVDCHTFLPDGDSDTYKDLMKKALNSISAEEREDVRKALNGITNGDEAGDNLFQALDIKYTYKKRWESIIQEWAKKVIVATDKSSVQWVRKNRRFASVDCDLILPTEMEVDDLYDNKHRLPVVFFLDLSGSCWDFSQRFYAAAKSLPSNRFDVTLYTFDTQVHRVDISTNAPVLRGGGGTSFDILEYECLNIERESEYPRAVFVITDGYGTDITPKIPNRWYWFLTTNHTDCIKSMKHFKLEDYE